MEETLDLALATTTPLHPATQALSEATWTRLPSHAHNQVGPHVGALLRLLVRLVNPQRVLELGTFTGYSALCLAEGLLSPTAHVVSIESDPKRHALATELIQSSPLSHRVKLVLGDADPFLAQQKEFELLLLSPQMSSCS